MGVVRAVLVVFVVTMVIMAVPMFFEFVALFSGRQARFGAFVGIALVFQVFSVVGMIVFVMSMPMIIVPMLVVPMLVVPMLVVPMLVMSVIVVPMLIVPMLIVSVVVTLPKTAFPRFEEAYPIGPHEGDDRGVVAQRFDRTHEKSFELRADPEKEIGIRQGGCFRRAHLIGMRRSSGRDDQLGLPDALHDAGHERVDGGDTCADIRRLGLRRTES
jgi:hypothetical protein